MSASLDLGTLKIKIGVDNGDAVKELDSTGSKLSSFASTAGNVLKGMATATTAAVGAASAAVAGLTKVALDNYASNEQLVGGVETLFKESSAQVIQYANDAYKTAGMSANDYMETVTGFSASLLQSLGGDTAAAAQVANQAVTDMSDNANKMGTYRKQNSWILQTQFGRRTEQRHQLLLTILRQG